MAKKVDDHDIELESTVDLKTANDPWLDTESDMPSDRDVLSGRDVPTTDGELFRSGAHPQVTRSGRAAHSNSTDGIVRVKAGKFAKDLAVKRLLKSSEKPPSKFIITANNMTDHDLTRSTSSGDASWPFSLIKKKECVAALFDHSHFKNLIAVFTADDDLPGIRTVMLYAHWPLIGHRSIGIYAGWICVKSTKIDRGRVHDHELHGNIAAINNPSTYYVFGYDIIQLQYAQFGVVAGKEAATEAVEKFTTFHIGSMPLFNFVVNNLTGYDLTLTEDKVEVQGSWPLGNIKKGECAVAGFNRLHMSLAVRYTACVNQQHKSISLAASWPVVGDNKTYVGEGMTAFAGWRELSKDCQNWPVPEGADDKLNSAYIQKVEGNVINSCVYVYVLRKL